MFDFLKKLFKSKPKPKPKSKKIKRRGGVKKTNDPTKIVLGKPQELPRELFEGSSKEREIPKLPEDADTIDKLVYKKKYGIPSSIVKTIQAQKKQISSDKPLPEGWIKEKNDYGSYYKNKDGIQQRDFPDSVSNNKPPPPPEPVAPKGWDVNFDSKGIYWKNKLNGNMQRDPPDLKAKSRIFKNDSIDLNRRRLQRQDISMQQPGKFKNIIDSIEAKRGQRRNPAELLPWANYDGYPQQMQGPQRANYDGYSQQMQQPQRANYGYPQQMQRPRQQSPFILKRSDYNKTGRVYVNDKYGRKIPGFETGGATKKTKKTEKTKK